MSKKISKKEFENAEAKLDEILALADKKGGFEFLSGKEKGLLEKYTAIVKVYEDEHYNIPMPQTIEGLIELKMYENKMKQKDLAKLMDVTETKLSEILHSKRKPGIVFLKAMHQKLGIDGNVLLKAIR